MDGGKEEALAPWNLEERERRADWRGMEGQGGIRMTLATCCPESPVSSMVTLSQAGNTVRGAPEVTCASEEAKVDICSPTQVEKLFFASISSSLLISDN